MPGVSGFIPYFGDYSILLQEKPGAGTLSFHITLEMP